MVTSVSATPMRNAAEKSSDRLRRKTYYDLAKMIVEHCLPEDKLRAIRQVRHRTACQWIILNGYLGTTTATPAILRNPWHIAAAQGIGPLELATILFITQVNQFNQISGPIQVLQQYEYYAVAICDFGTHAPIESVALRFEWMAMSFIYQLISNLPKGMVLKDIEPYFAAKFREDNERKVERQERQEKENANLRKALSKFQRQTSQANLDRIFSEAKKLIKKHPTWTANAIGKAIKKDDKTDKLPKSSRIREIIHDYFPKIAKGKAGRRPKTP